MVLGFWEIYKGLQVVAHGLQSVRECFIYDITTTNGIMATAFLRGLGGTNDP